MNDTNLDFPIDYISGETLFCCSCVYFPRRECYKVIKTVRFLEKNTKKNSFQKAGLEGGQGNVRKIVFSQDGV